MTAFRQIPVRAEVALARSIADVIAAGGDVVTAKAIVQSLAAELAARKFALRPGFELITFAAVDRSGRDYRAELAEKVANPSRGDRP